MPQRKFLGALRLMRDPRVVPFLRRVLETYRDGKLLKRCLHCLAERFEKLDDMAALECLRELARGENRNLARVAARAMGEHGIE